MAKIKHANDSATENKKYVISWVFLHEIHTFSLSNAASLFINKIFGELFYQKRILSLPTSILS